MKKAFFTIFTLMIFSLNTFAAASKQIHVGDIKYRELLEQYPLFAQEYAQYQPESSELEALNSLSTEVKVKVFFGTWCHDSQREVPRLLKYLETTSNLRVELYALDIKKQDPQMLSAQFKIKYTPTFIIMNQDKEVFRIVERPVKSLIEDITTALTK